MALGAQPAAAMTSDQFTSVLLWNRATGAWALFKPDSLMTPGSFASGVDGARFVGAYCGFAIRRISPTLSIRRLVLIKKQGRWFGPPSPRPTQTWDVVRLGAQGWLSEGSGSIGATDAEMTPSGTLDGVWFDTGADIFRATQYFGNGLRTGWYMRVSLQWNGSWVWRLISRARDSADGTPHQYLLYQAANGGRLYSWCADLRIKTHGISYTNYSYVDDWFYRVSSYLTPPPPPPPPPPPSSKSFYWVFGGVYGNGLQCYQYETGTAYFIRLNSAGDVDGSTADSHRPYQLAVGWWDCVAFRNGWFYYHRDRRCAQMARLDSNGNLVNGYFWPDGSLGAFTDIAAFA